MLNLHKGYFFHLKSKRKIWGLSIAAVIGVFIIAAAVYIGFEGFGRKSGRQTADTSGAIAAEFTIHSFDGAYGALAFLPNFGHSFFSVKNLSDQNFTVGVYEVEPGEELSVGIWGTSAHSGVWYNLESIYYELGKYDTAITLTKNISLADIDSLSAHVLAHDRWTFFYNCSTFTLNAWNSVSTADSLKVFGLASPNKLRHKMQEFTKVSGMKTLTSFREAGYYSGGKFILYELDA